MSCRDSSLMVEAQSLLWGHSQSGGGGRVGWAKALTSEAAQSEGGGTTPAPWASPVLSRGFHSLMGRALSTPT